MDMYSELEKLKKLLEDGVITREEFEREKARILSMHYSVEPSSWDFGIDERTFVVLMHASQFLSAFIAPFIMWILFKEKSRLVDEAGKNILNFQISYTIYCIVLLITCVGIVLIPLVGLFSLVLIVIGIIKALNSESWKYPLSIQFLK